MKMYLIFLEHLRQVLSQGTASGHGGGEEPESSNNEADIKTAACENEEVSDIAGICAVGHFAGDYMRQWRWQRCRVKKIMRQI